MSLLSDDDMCNCNCNDDGDSLNEYAYKMQMDRFKVFKEQDREKGHLDVAFEIEGKKLYVNKYLLTTASEPLNAWLSDRWSTKDEVIKIEDYSYDCFYEFIQFIYTGRCDLCSENVFKMVDMAEFYVVPYLKEFCDTFLSRMEKSGDTLEELFEFAEKYSLSKCTQSIKKFVRYYSEEVYYEDIFLPFKKPFVEFLSTIDEYPDEHCCYYQEGEFFEMAYKWAEHRVTKEKAVAENENFNLFEAIKSELSTILPRIKFSKMTFEFLMSFVVGKGFLISPAELSKIFSSKKNCFSEQSSFKMVYLLAEKRALKKKEMFPNDEGFNLVESIKADLIDVIPNVAFYKMDKSFLTDFVVSKGIISETQASHVYDTFVEITNNGDVVSGAFKDDDVGILRSFEKKRSRSVTRQSTKKIRFLNLKFPIPSTPSTVTKMAGVEWYLCLEKNQVLTFKHHSMVDRSDFLLTEMSSDTEFQLTPNETTFITARHNNI